MICLPLPTCARSSCKSDSVRAPTLGGFALAAQDVFAVFEKDFVAGRRVHRPKVFHGIGSPFRQPFEAGGAPVLPGARIFVGDCAGRLDRFPSRVIPPPSCLEMVQRAVTVFKPGAKLVLVVIRIAHKITARLGVISRKRARAAKVESVVEEITGEGRMVPDRKSTRL